MLVLFNLRPLARYGRSAEATRDALNQPEAFLSGDALKMFRDARNADGVTQTSDQDRDTATYAAAFEREVEARLVAARVPFITEVGRRSCSNPGLLSWAPSPRLRSKLENELKCDTYEITAQLSRFAFN